MQTLREALALCVAGARYSEYDRLYALYSIVDSLGRLAANASANANADGARFTELSNELIGDAESALSTVDRAVGAAGGTDHDCIRDTKVRILLRQGRDHDAYLIVDQVLARNPGFADFGDLREAHRGWKASAEGGVA